MKFYKLLSLGLLCSASLAVEFQTEVEKYDKVFTSINEQRKGLNESEIKSLSDPFIKTKSISKDNNNSAGGFDLQAIFNNKAKINGKWYQIKDSIGEYELIKIKNASVVLASKEQKIDLNLTKGANKNVIIKIK